MKRLAAVGAFFLLASVFSSSAGYADCRFWAAVGEKVPADVILHQLTTDSVCLKVLGKEYKDGWAVGYYKDNTVFINRGSKSANEDDNFDVAVKDAADENPNVVVAHLRLASSGCVGGIPNPHPFKRTLGGKIWLFGHNGTIAKDILIRLLGEDYLKARPPSVCSEHPPDSWIDSELYFLLLLKSIEANDGRVVEGIQAALAQLEAALGTSHKALNFFLTDGKNVWAFRNGPTLFYRYDQADALSVVASTPSENDGRWQEIDNDVLVVMTPQDSPRLIAFHFSENP